MFEALAATLGQREPEWVQVCFCYGDEEDLLAGRKALVLRGSADMLRGGTGCAVWQASLVLASLLLAEPELVAGRDVLELGCGTGLVVCVARRLGARSVVGTDGDAEALENAAHNLARNGVDQCVFSIFRVTSSRVGRSKDVTVAFAV